MRSLALGFLALLRFSLLQVSPAEAGKKAGRPRSTGAGFGRRPFFELRIAPSDSEPCARLRGTTPQSTATVGPAEPRPTWRPTARPRPAPLRGAVCAPARATRGAHRGRARRIPRRVAGGVAARLPARRPARDAARGGSQRARSRDVRHRALPVLLRTRRAPRACHVQHRGRPVRDAAAGHH